MTVVEKRPVTVRYESGIVAVHSDLHGALSQAVHDLHLPGQLSPVAIHEGDITVDAAHPTTGEITDPREFGVPLLNKAAIRTALKDIPCDCDLCGDHRENRKSIASMIAQHTKEREFTEAEIRRLEWLQKKYPKVAGGAIPFTGYRVTWTAMGLTAATAKTFVGLASGANKPLHFVELSFGGDATSGSCLVELVFGTNATNPPGTNSTAFTALTSRGSSTFEGSAATAWSAEPTVLTALGRWRFPWPGGPGTFQLPLGREPQGVIAASTSGKLIALRATSSVTVTNFDGHTEAEEM